jgi:transposase-like protein
MKNKAAASAVRFSLNLISENEKLKKENARLTDERDILKKALGLFSRSS